MEYETPEMAVAAVKQLHGVPLDKKHIMAVNKLMDIERYGREGRVEEEYKAPAPEPFKEKEHLRSWMGDANARDQFALYRNDKVGVFWNNKTNPPENVVDRAHWTQLFVQWSPKGTFLASVHPQGVQLWGGESFSKQKQFPHPFVQLIEFSPLEGYLTTWSARPIQVEEGQPILTYEEDGKNIIVWDIETGKPLRSFVSHDLAAPTEIEGEVAPKKKVQWPAFKWSADEKYVARMLQGQSLSIYELPNMNLLGRTSVKIEGAMDFEWSPATVAREGVKQYEQLLCFWTPEIGSNPARVGMMSVPSKEIVRTRNLFNVSDVKLHWQSQGAYVCVKVDRHSKSKKSMATNLEIFRVREKGVPVEVVDSLKDTVINFAWEPNGSRFVVIANGETPTGAAVLPKTSVSFFAPEKKGHTAGNFKLVRTIEKKTSNGIYWSPKGRFVVVATVHSQTNFDLDFWDMDFEGEKIEAEKDLAANLQLMKTVEHYGVTDVDWDSTGRYVVSSASVWTHSVSFNLVLSFLIHNIDRIIDGERLEHAHLLRHYPLREPHRKVQAVPLAPTPCHSSQQGGAEASSQEPPRVLKGVRGGRQVRCRYRQHRRCRDPQACTQRMARLAPSGEGALGRREGGFHPPRERRYTRGRRRRAPGCRGPGRLRGRGDCGGDYRGDRGGHWLMNLSVLFSQIMCFLLFLFSPCFSAGVSRLCLNPAFCPLVFILGPLGKPSEDRDIPKIDRSSGAPPDQMCNVDKHERWLRNQFLAKFNLVFLLFKSSKVSHLKYKAPFPRPQFPILPALSPMSSPTRIS